MMRMMMAVTNLLILNSFLRIIQYLLYILNWQQLYTEANHIQWE